MPPIRDRPTIDFDSIIAPMSRATFLGSHWNRMLLFQHGQTDRFGGLLGWEGLSRILEQHDIPPPRLRLVRDGRSLAPSDYRSVQRGRERLDLGRLRERLAAGAALVLDEIDLIVPAFGALADDVAEALDASVTINLYAGMRGSRGFDLHRDAQDVMILQLAGRKQWRVHAPTEANPLRETEATQPAGPPDWSGELRDGDMLYLPRGWWHAAETGDAPSLHLTVTIVPARGVDVLAWLMQRLADDPLVRADIPHGSDPDARAAYFAGLLDAAVDAMRDDTAPARFIEARLASRSIPSRISLPLAPPPASLGDASMIQLAGMRALLFEQAADGAIRFQAGGRSWACPPALRDGLGRLRGDRATGWRRLSADLSATDRGALARLLLALRISGVIDICDDADAAGDL